MFLNNVSVHLLLDALVPLRTAATRLTTNSCLPTAAGSSHIYRQRNMRRRKSDRVNLFSSPLYLASDPQKSFSCLIFRGWGVNVEHIDFVGDVLWPFIPAWSLFGVPASMRTRTQTVNHLCIF